MMADVLKDCLDDEVECIEYEVSKDTRRFLSMMLRTCSRWKKKRCRGFESNVTGERTELASHPVPS